MNEEWEFIPDQWRPVIDDYVKYECACDTGCGNSMEIEFDGTQLITIVDKDGRGTSFILPSNLMVVRKVE